MLVHVSFDEVISEGIGEGVVSREGREDDVPELDAVRRDGFDEGVVVFGEELGEVVEEDEEDPHRSLEEDSGRFLHLGCREEGREELEEGDEEGVVLGPVLKTRGTRRRLDLRRDEKFEKKEKKRLTLSFSAAPRSLGMKRWCEMRDIHENANPGRSVG